MLIIIIIIVIIIMHFFGLTVPKNSLDFISLTGSDHLAVAEG